MYVKPDASMPGAQRLNAILSSMSQSEVVSHADSALRKRQLGYGYGYGYGYNGWSGYGRWIVLGVVVGLALLIWLSVCFCNRRRTRAGNQPVKYTGWATPGFQHPQQTGIVNNYNTQPYTAPSQNTQYPMQNYAQYPQSNTTYPQANNYSAQQYPQGQTYNSSVPSEYNNYNGAIGNDYNQPPSYPAAPAAVAGREK